MNANSIVTNLLESKKENENKIFKNNFKLNLNLNEVYIDEIYFVKNLQGLIFIKDNEVVDTNLSANFENNKNIVFSIETKNNGEKITKLYSSKAKPLVKRYKFIKGFDEGNLDFISTKINGKSGSKPLQPSFFYPWAGQLISRSGFDTQAHWSFFDVGPWGTGHQHQDKLHLSVTAFGTDFLVDSGRFAYRGSVADQYRPYARSSSAHNVVLIDDKNQNPGPTEVKNALDNTHFKIHKDYDYAYGDFNDFENLSGSALHTRAIFYLRNGFWLVADKIKTDRPRALKFLWHWHPDVKIIKGKKNIKGRHKNGTLSLTALSDQNFKISEIKGQLEPSVQGWYSPEYNIYAPNSVTEFSTNIDQEQHFLWLIVPESEDSPALSMDKIKTHEDHFKIEFTFNGQKKKLVLPFEDATKVDLN